MKRFKKVFALLLCMVCFSAFALGSTDETNSSTTVSGGNSGSSSTSSSSSSSNSTVKEEDPFAGIKIEFLDKKNVNADIYNGIYMPRCEFTIKISNTTGKTIRGLQANVEIKDMFGDRIKKLELELTDEIDSGYSLTKYDKCLEINEFIDSDVELWNTDYKDLTFIVTVTNVVYK